MSWYGYENGKLPFHRVGLPERPKDPLLNYILRQMESMAMENIPDAPCTLPKASSKLDINHNSTNSELEVSKVPKIKHHCYYERGRRYDIGHDAMGRQAISRGFINHRYNPSPFRYKYRNLLQQGWECYYKDEDRRTQCPINSHEDKLIYHHFNPKYSYKERFVAPIFNKN